MARRSAIIQKIVFAFVLVAGLGMIAYAVLSYEDNKPDALEEMPVVTEEEPSRYGEPAGERTED